MLSILFLTFDRIVVYDIFNFLPFLHFMFSTIVWTNIDTHIYTHVHLPICTGHTRRHARTCEYINMNKHMHMHTSFAPTLARTRTFACILASILTDAHRPPPTHALTLAHRHARIRHTRALTRRHMHILIRKHEHIQPCNLA